jgi:thioredoxin-dependent peroxiredoxin
MSIPAAGEKAPGFTALDERGERISLSDFKGRPVVLYFYPVSDG